MDVRTAAIQVLQQAGTALHAKDIAEQIMAAGLWQSGGKTPDATVSARLYSDIKSNGDKSPFVKVGPQTFALRSSAEIPSGAGAGSCGRRGSPKTSSYQRGIFLHRLRSESAMLKWKIKTITIREAVNFLMESSGSIGITGTTWSVS